LSSTIEQDEQQRHDDAEEQRSEESTEYRRENLANRTLTTAAVRLRHRRRGGVPGGRSCRGFGLLSRSHTDKVSVALYCVKYTRALTGGNV